MSREVETSLDIASPGSSQRFLDFVRNDKSKEATGCLFTALSTYYDDDEHSAAMNMAIDEALLDSVAIPSIRFYRWRSPALSFGYFGKFTDVADYVGERDLVRRWTGGGIVFHGEDLTYSIVVPPSDPVFSESSSSIYAAIHASLCHGLASIAERGELAHLGGVLYARTAKL